MPYSLYPLYPDCLNLSEPTMDNSAARPPTLEASPLHSERCSPSSEPAVKTAPSLLSSTDEVKRQTPAKDAVAGAFSGAFAKTVVAPIERVKLLMQLQFSIENSSKNGGRTSSATAQTPSTERSTKKYGAWEFAKIVYREQGILAFWRGKALAVVGKIDEVHHMLCYMLCFFG